MDEVFHSFSPSRCDTVLKFDLLLKNGVIARAKEFWKEGLDKGTHGERLARRGREAWRGAWKNLENSRGPKPREAECTVRNEGPGLTGHQVREEPASLV